jgi:Immunoglobulin-like domain of bacterial spore germination
VKELVLAVLAAVALAGCGSSRQPQARPTALTVFQLRGGILRPLVVHVPANQPLAAAALRALGVQARVAIQDGTAAVDLPSASDTRVAEIVYTLTQLASVRRVDVAGRHGLTRDDFASYVPPILVVRPAPGAVVRPTFVVSGTASVFEATLVVEAVRNRRILTRRTVTASEGAPARGTFRTALTASRGPLLVRVFAPSAADGAPQHEVDVGVSVGG